LELVSYLVSKLVL